MPGILPAVFVDEYAELDGEDAVATSTEVERIRTLQEARQLFHAARWSEDLNRPQPPWLVPGFLQSQAIHVLSAPKAARKTWLGLYTMLAGIYGTEWLGTEIPRPFNSVYIAADSPRWDIRSQVKRLLIGMGRDPEFPLDSGSFILPYGFKFTNMRHTEVLSRLISAWNIRALFVDVLLYTYDGLSENDNTDMGNLFQVIKFFRDNLGVAVVLLHHHAKNPEVGARGAGTILQACEHHYELRRSGADKTIITREKLRGDEAGLWDNIAFTLGRAGAGRVLSVDTWQPPGEIVAQLTMNPTMSRAELVAALSHRSARWVDTQLAAMRQRELAASEGGVWRLL